MEAARTAFDGVLYMCDEEAIKMVLLPYQKMICLSRWWKIQLFA